MNCERILALDVDQTLAGGVVPAHIKQYNRDLDLGLTARDEEISEKYPKTFDVPAIQQWRSGGVWAEERFQTVRKSIRTSPEVHLNLKSIPESVDGVKYLTEQELILGGYWSIRPEGLQRTTERWLAQNGYPLPEKTVLCQNHEDKITRLLQITLKKKPTEVVLIDDNLEELGNRG